MKYLHWLLVILVCLTFASGQDTYFDVVYNKFGETLISVYKHGNNSYPAFGDLNLEEILNPEKFLQFIRASENEASDALFEDSITDVTTSAPMTSPAPELPQVTSLCWNHTQKMVLAVTNNEMWAKEMLDSFGRPESLLPQNILQLYLGNFDQCQGVKTDDFVGQYCLATVGMANVFNPLTQKQGAEIQVGLCMPSTCSMTDNMNMLNTVIELASNKTVKVTGGTCKKPEIPYDDKAIVALSVISVFAAFLVVGTVYDIVIRQISKNQKNVYEMAEPETGNKDQSNGKAGKTVNGTDTKGQTNGGFEHTGNDTNNSKTNGVFMPESDMKYKLSQPASIKMPETTKTSNKYEPGKLGKLLLAFSVYTNGEKILSAKQGGGTLTAVNGIRFISMSWVILGHTYAFGFQTASNGMKLYGTLISRKTFMAIINAEVSVDTFFALSGTLLTYVVLKQLKNGKGSLNWGMFYFHRFWRLTPVYMLVLMIQVTLARYFTNGPRWPVNGFEKNYCKNTWWWNLLYINNFKSSGEECFAHAWYLANDMQFYVISPPILLALYHSKIAGTIVVGILWLAHVIVAGYITAKNNLDVNPMAGGDYFDMFYQKPYTRIGPYLVGMYTGYILFTKNCKCRMNKHLVRTLWLVFAVSACAVLYGPYEHINGNKMSNELAAFYNAVHKSVWGLAVCWVIFACATGNGGFVNTILSWKGIVPLSRLTYCAYLIHPMLMYTFYFSRKHLLFWDDFQVVYEFFGHMVAAYAVALVTSLAFESPMMGIEKVIFRPSKKK